MTPQDMIKRYQITFAPNDTTKLMLSGVKRVKAEGMLDEVVAHKAEIIAILTAEREAAEKAAAEHEAKIEAIEGLDEIYAAIEEHERHRAAFERAMYRGDGILPGMPKSDIKALCAKYPREAAYIQACEYSNSENLTQMGIGIRAKECIINGEDYEQVLADMEKEWGDYCHEHIWD